MNIKFMRIKSVHNEFITSDICSKIYSVDQNVRAILINSFHYVQITSVSHSYHRNERNKNDRHAADMRNLVEKRPNFAFQSEKVYF